MAPFLSQLLGRTCTLIIFGFTVSSVLDNPQWSSLPRNLDVAEFWAGVGNIAKNAEEANLRTLTVEKGADPLLQDLLTETGFLHGVGRIMQLRPGGLLTMAPVCSSWGFANTANTGRNKNNFRGNLNYAAVAHGNLSADIACFFLFLCIAREVHAVIENPAGSMLFSYLSKHLSPLRFLVVACTPRCAFSTEPLGQRYLKRFKFLATGSWISAIIRSCPCQGLGHLALMTVDESGGRTGIAEAMLSSQAYPWDLGAAIIQAWRQAGSSHSFGEILASMPPTTGKQRQHQFRRQSLEVPEVNSSASDEEPSQSESKGNAGPWDQDSSDSDQPVHKGPWEDSDPVDPVDYGPWGSSHSPNPTEVAKEDDNPWSSEPQPKRSKQQQRPLTSQLPAARDSPWA